MAEVDQVKIQIEVLCDTCKKMLVVTSSSRNTTSNAANVDGFFRVFTAPCETCSCPVVDKTIYVELDVNEESLEFKVEYD